VLFKSDGMPTYHLANIVDDHSMKITHVIRGEEWLPSVPLHIALYQAFDWEVPKFAHLPLIMKPVGKGKLSKRDGDKMGFPVFPIQWKTNEGEVFSGYREDGYFPETVINMLALLGWNPGTEQEIFSLSELVEVFDLGRINKAGAKFDPEKTKWFQHHYLQVKDNKMLTSLFSKFLENKGIVTNKDLSIIVESIKDRATFVSDLWEQGSFFFTRPTQIDTASILPKWNAEKSAFFDQLIQYYQQANPWTTGELEKICKDLAQQQQLKIGELLLPLRIMLVGGKFGPGVFDIAYLLGKEETVERLTQAKRLILQGA
jgi:glutamyl-tRNA synthetase